MDEYTEPHWGAAALVVIELQRDFLDDGRVSSITVWRTTLSASAAKQ
ncbi:hypothetical protein [Mycobacterium sp. E2989]|nr:hypothetical protein [Mycobacterium sp. E2989]